MKKVWTMLRRRIDQEDRRQRQAHQACEDPERGLRAGDAHRLDARAEIEDHAERREHHDPAQRRAVERRADTGQHLAVAERGDGGCGIVGGGQHHGAECGQAGDCEAERHKVVNLEHIGAQALVDGRVGAGTRVHGACLIVSKVSHGFLCVASAPSGVGRLLQAPRRRWRDSSMPVAEYDASLPSGQDP